jgi:hypothetical protein
VKTGKIKPPVIETVPLSKLKPWDRNPRIKHAVDAISMSIEKLGYLAPIIVQKNTYRILAGHGRLKALRVLKIKEVPVIVADINDKNADLYTLADNRLHDVSIFDMKALSGMLKGLGTLNLKMTGFTEMGEMSVGMKGKEVLAKDIDEASQKLRGQIDDRQRRFQEVACPKCGHEFVISAETVKKVFVGANAQSKKTK